MDPRRARFEDLIRESPPVPGLKFHPTNEQVINFYLQNKIAGNLVEIDPIRTDQDIISHHPGTLPAHYPLLPPEIDWWFYTTRDSKYPNNSKLKIERAGGYWKVSKASDPIGDIGFKRVLNFREGSVKPSSTPTDWYMEEYSIKKFAPNKEDENWIIARIYQQLTMPMPPNNIVPMTMPLSTEPIQPTFPPDVNTVHPRILHHPTHFVPSQSSRSQLIYQGSLSPDTMDMIDAWLNSDVYSGEGGISGSADAF